MEYAIFLRETVTDTKGDVVDAVLCKAYHVTREGIYFKHEELGGEGFIPMGNVRLIITKKEK